MKRTSSLSATQMMLLLAKIPFFRDFTPHEKELILDHAYFYVAQKEEKIIVQNTIDNDFYILLKGKADVVLDSNSKAIAHIPAGDFFGEMSFVLNVARTSNVIATVDCILLQVNRALLDNLEAVIREKFKDQIIQKMAHHITEMNKKVFH